MYYVDEDVESLKEAGESMKTVMEKEEMKKPVKKEEEAVEEEVKKVDAIGLKHTNRLEKDFGWHVQNERFSVRLHLSIMVIFMIPTINGIMSFRVLSESKCRFG